MTRFLFPLAFIAAAIVLFIPLPSVAQLGNASALQGRPVCPDAPNDTNSLVWSNARKCWAPGAGSGGTGGVSLVNTTAPITGGAITSTGAVACPTCTTSAAPLGANLPVVGAGGQATAVGTKRGNTNQFVTYSGAAPATNDYAKFDASGNLVTGGALPAGGGTPAGSTGDLQYNAGGGAFGGRTPHGTGTAPQMFTGTSATNDCAKFDASGNLVSNGSPCGGGGGSPGGATGSIQTNNGAGGFAGGNLAGDVSSSGLNTSVDSVHGVLYPSGPSLHSIPVVTNTGQVTYVVLPDCQDTGGQHLNFRVSDNTFPCGTSGGGAGTNATQLQGRDICNDAPSTGTPLYWDSTRSCWSPGSGTASSAAFFPELAANGSNFFAIYGADNQASNGCIIVSGQPTAQHQVLADAGSTATTTDGQTCRVMAWETPVPAGGGSSLGTGGWVDPANMNWLSSSNYSTAPPAARTVFLWKFKVEAAVDIHTVSYPVAAAGDTVVFGIYDRTCTTRLGQTTPLAHTTVADISTFTSTVSLTPGIYYMAWTSDGTNSRGFSPIYDGGLGYLQAALKKGPSNAFLLGTGATGSGGSLALNSSCGSTSDGDVLYTWAVRLWN